MTSFRPITACLFDMDGLLLQTESVYTEVTQSIVAQFGKTYDWSIKANMIGRPAIDSARYLVEVLDLPISAEQYLEERNGMLREGFANCAAMPGAEALVRHLAQQQIPIAVATSSSQELFDIKTRQHRDWFDLFQCVITPEDSRVKQGKPAPDIFLAAAQELGAKAESCLVFEDAPSGLAAGVAAAMQVVAVPDPNMPKDRYDEATVVIDSLQELDLAAFALPPL